MANEPARLWDRLPLRLKGALIVGAPIAALLLVSATSFWVDWQNDEREALAEQTREAHSLLDHVSHELVATAFALQRYTTTEDPDALPAIDAPLLSDVRRVGRLVHPETGETYPGVAQASGTVRELLLRADMVGREMAALGEPTERGEDTLDHLSERITAYAELLEQPMEQTSELADRYESQLQTLENREQMVYGVTLLVGLLGGVGAAGFFARNFTARISDLGSAAERLAAGDCSRPFPRGSDEIGALGDRLYGALTAVRAGEERARLILETSTDGYTAIDHEGVVIAWNRAAEAILGWSKEEAIGRPLPELVIPADGGAEFAARFDAFRSGAVSELPDGRLETTALHKDGRHVPIELSIVPIEDEGRLTFHSFVRDLTDAKRVEAETVNRARRMAGIIRTMSEMASAGMDVRRLHTLLLERARALTDADGAALQLEHDGALSVVAGVGRVASQVGRKLDIATTMTGRAMTTGKTFVTGDVERENDVDAPLARAIGTRSALAVPLSDAGRVVGVLAVHAARVDAFDEADVTDLELLGGFFGAVSSKIEAYDAREVVVRERTEALKDLHELHHELAAKNEALVLATREATAANHAKSEFLSRMSHELRTPLNAILGFTQLLQTEGLDDDQIDSLGHIENAGRHLLGLINEVLEIARIESGNTVLSMGPVSVGDAVRETVDLIRPLAARRDVEITFGGDATAFADSQKLKQILLNLLSNAVKYNRDGGSVAVGVTTAGDAVDVTVSDTGPGIAPDRLASLFTPFARLGAEQTPVEGSGLGLAVSKTLTDAMGGELTVSSIEGSGSTFALRLQRSEPGVPPPNEVSPPASRGTPARNRRQTVVYVEDNVPNARLVERALRRLTDVELAVAPDGNTGFALAVESAPALILLDMNLPDTNGIDLLRRLRSDDRTSSTPIVVVSADATRDQREAAAAAGANGYLTKPVDLAELVATVERATNAMEDDA